VDSDFGLDLDEIRRNLDTAEVITVWFPLLRRTLLVDTRHSETEPPLVRVVPTASSVEDRLRSLKKLRPRFPTPESVTLVPWPKYLESLRTLGLWDGLLARLGAIGPPSVLQDCDRVWRALAQLERDEIEAALRGSGYRSLWERTP
jgi:hypothetical protein